MNIIDEDNDIFGGADRETISVTVTGNNTKFLVTFSLDGNLGTMTEGEPLKFTLNKAAHSTSKLLLVLAFAAPAGETPSYDVAISGDPAGQRFIHNYLGSFGVPVVSPIYFFEIA